MNNGNIIRPDTLGLDITPEMIEAGATAMALYEPSEPSEWIVAAVYEAMVKARTSKS